MRKRTRFKWLLYPLLVLAVILALGWLYQTVTQAREARLYPAPGQLIDVGGHKLHLVCKGEGSPTVILDSGNGDNHLAWSWVMPEVAKTTRVCAYDRAGYGWSEPGPSPRTVEQAVRELHALLDRAAIKGPYIMVGHSYGGMVARLYAGAYPGDVAGVVLVDSAHEEQESRFPPDVAAQQKSMQRLLAGARYLAPFSVLRLMGVVLAPSNLPEDVKPMAKAMGSRTHAVFATYGEVASWGNATEDFKKAPFPKAIPLTVLSANRQDPPEMAPIWQALQKDLASLSTNGTHTVAATGDHYIHTEEPQTVIDAIRQMIQKGRPR